MARRTFALGVATIALATVGFSGAAEARDQIRIVGSSTVFPFSTLVAEQFGRTTDFKTPVVESTGSGGGLKLFCAGVGVDHPDITNASRAIKDGEKELCASNGVTSVTEVKVGFDGIVIANSSGSERLSLTREQIFEALAAEVEVDGQVVANPHQRWSDIDPSLPDAEIEVLGPPPTSGTRDAFVELVMEEACESFPAITALDEDRMEEVCATMREDGKFVEAGENDNLIVQRLAQSPAALGIFGFSFLDQNPDKIQGSLVDGQEPTFENIASGAYPVSRSLSFYVKNQHVGVISGMAEYVSEFTSDRAFGPDGYLIDEGLIPLPEADRKTIRSNAANQVNILN